MAEEFSTELKKTLDGVNYALAAQAEVLSKMDARLSKAEEEEQRQKEEEEEAMAKSAFMKEVALSVFNMLKSVDQGMDVSMEPRPAKAPSTMWPIKGDSEDPAEDADLDTATENVQRTIQASAGGAGTTPIRKNAPPTMGAAVPPAAPISAQDTAPDEGEGEDEEEEEVGANEYPVREEEGEEEPEEERGGMMDKGIYAAMKAEIAELKKMITDIRKSEEPSEAVRAELAKYGFREAKTGLQKPKLIKYDNKPLGADLGTTIKKAQTPEDVVEQLSKMSYSDLIKADLEARPLDPEEGLLKSLSGNLTN